MPNQNIKPNSFLSFLQHNSFIIFNAICGVFVIFLLFRTLAYEYAMITHPYQLQYREGAILLTTEKLLNGENPYSIENQPYGANVYGIMYSVIGLPLANFFGNTFIVHRFISAFFAVLCASLVAWILKRQKVMLVYCLAGAGIMYCSLLFHKTITAEPDAIGLFSFLLAIYLCKENDFSKRSLFICLLLSIVVFYTKSYFILTIPIICSYLFLFRSKQKGVIYGVIFLFIFAIFLVFSYQIIPTFILFMFYSKTIIGHGKDITYSWFQMKNFIGINIGLVVLGVFLLILKLMKKQKTKYETLTSQIKSQNTIQENLQNKSYSLNFGNWNEPLIQNTKITIYTYALLVSLFLVIFILGGTRGAYLYYHFTFLTPFLVIVVLSATQMNLEVDFSVNRYQTLQLNGHTIMLSLALLGFWGTFANKGKLKEMTTENVNDWEKIRTYITQSNDILNVSSTANLLHEQGKKVYDNGHTEYLVDYQDKAITLLDKDLQNLKAKNNEFKQEVMQKIAAQKFDLILHDNGSHWYLSENDLAKTYLKIDSVLLNMPHMGYDWKTTVWKPKNSRK
jgi:hypothetical protein